MLKRLLQVSSALAILSFVFAGIPTPAAHAIIVPTVLYVAPGGLTSGACDSWAHACDLQYALGIAASSDQLWVEKGVYKPTTNPSDTTASFIIPSGVAVYGGFAGTESSLSGRNWTTNVTILSGDIDNNDANAGTTNIDATYADIAGANSNNVVKMDGTSTAVTSLTVLDGFTITGGQATGGGGGMLCDGSGAVGTCSPTLQNLIFSGNDAAGEGGGLFDNAASGGVSSPTITDATFTGNRGQSGGGAISNDAVVGGTSSPTLTRVTFYSNVGVGGGGAMFNLGDYATSSPSLTDVTFDSNQATQSGNGGGILDFAYSAITFTGASSPTLRNVTFRNNSASLDGGGMFFQCGSGLTTCNPQLTNVTFSGNQAAAGGGMENQSVVAATVNLALTNVTFQGNSASSHGGGLDNHGGILYSNSVLNATVINVILWGDTAGSAGPEIFNEGISPSIGHSVIQGSKPGGVWDTSLGVDNGGNLDTNPVLGPLANNGGYTQTMALLSGSSAIDTGDDLHCPSPDQRGVTRPQGPHCDIGAYEHFYPPILYSLSNGVTGGDCSSWGVACNLPYALSTAISGEQVWVQAGTYYPTDSLDRTQSFMLKNGVAIYGGFSGSETLLSQRNPAVNITTLSGDIGTVGDPSDNSYHVVQALGTDSSAVLDGFVIRGGNANGSATQGDGGGIYNTGLPTLVNLTLTGNHAGSFGGGIYSDVGTPQVTDSTFDSNSAGLGGGGMYNNGNSPILYNLTFHSNSAGSYGGAMENDSTETLLRNITFNGNSAGTGGGALDNTNSLVSIHNSILWGDSAAGGPEVFNSSSTIGIDHSIVQGGDAGSNGGTDFSSGTGNLSANPELGALHSNGGATKTMALITGSPAIDGGTNTNCPSTDQRGLPRPVDGNFDTIAVCDMGAVEYQGHLFADVPVTGKEWMEPWIDAFYYDGITTGCGIGPLIYCPENNVTRAEMAVFLLRAIHGPSYTPPNVTGIFADMPVTGKEWMEPWVDEFYNEGLTTGCATSPLRFCPEDSVTRQVMAVFILRAIHGGAYSPPLTSGIFADMPVTGLEWMESWVDEFYNEGITTGCGVSPLIYCPTNDVTRAEMAVFIDRAFHLYP